MNWIQMPFFVPSFFSLKISFISNIPLFFNALLLLYLCVLSRHSTANSVAIQNAFMGSPISAIFLPTSFLLPLSIQLNSHFLVEITAFKNESGVVWKKKTHFHTWAFSNFRNGCFGCLIFVFPVHVWYVFSHVQFVFYIPYFFCFFSSFFFSSPKRNRKSNFQSSNSDFECLCLGKETLKRNYDFECVMNGFLTACFWVWRPRHLHVNASISIWFPHQLEAWGVFCIWRGSEEEGGAFRGGSGALERGGNRERWVNKRAEEWKLQYGVCGKCKPINRSSGHSISPCPFALREGWICSTPFAWCEKWYIELLRTEDGGWWIVDDGRRW